MWLERKAEPLSEKVLIEAEYILKWEDGLEIIPQGELVVEDGCITYAGPRRETKDTKKYTNIIKKEKSLVMPGLINTHTHAAMTLFRGYADDLPLMDWLEKKIWPAEAKLDGEDVYWGTLLAICEMIRGGTTCFADMYFFMEEVARAVLESGMRASLARGLIGLEELSSQVAIEENKTLLKNWHGEGDGRITVMFGPHAPYTCPPDFLKKIIALADEFHKPLHIHLAETREEVENCYKDYGKTPVELMLEIGLFEHNVLAAHCVHLTPGDIEIISKKNVAVAHNPGSNLKLGSGNAPLSKLLQNNVLVSLGTDGAASNNNLDLFEEVRLAALLPKGMGENSTVVPAEEALKLATYNGAKALYLEKETGTLREGSRADLIIVNLEKPHCCPLYNPVAHLVYSAAASDVELVMVDGRILYEKGELKTVDEERIFFEARQRAFKLIKS
jgi:5-methylthioadenosine/S-adenosylhomocysteine deaminase